MLVDDMGMNDVGYLSSDLSELSPNLDSLATDGIILERYYTPQLCTPARSALFTSKYPMKLGMQYENIHPDMPWGLGTDETLLSERMKALGYRTHLVGKWNQGHYTTAHLPTSRGFDSFMGYLSDEINYMTHLYPQSLGGDDYTDFHLDEGSGMTTVSNSGTFSTELYLERVLDVVKAHDASDPLFLMWTSQNVHGPLDSVPSSLLTSAAVAALDTLDSEEGRHRAVFGSLLSALDRDTGMIVEAMKAQGLWDTTVMVMASDNGGCSDEGGSNSPLRGGKHWMFEGGVRVPSFVYSASTALVSSALRGTKYSNLMYVTDWMPTLLEALGKASSIEDADDLDAVSHWRAMMKTSEEAPRESALLSLSTWTTCCNTTAAGAETCSGFLSDCYDESTATLSRLSTPRAAVVRSDGFKLILNEYGIGVGGGPAVVDEDAEEAATLTVETTASADGNPMNNCGTDPGTTPGHFLFDLSTDPTETTNLYSDSAHAAAAKALREVVDTYVKLEAVPRWKNADTDAYATWEANDYTIVPWKTEDTDAGANVVTTVHSDESTELEIFISNEYSSYDDDGFPVTEYPAKYYTAIKDYPIVEPYRSTKLQVHGALVEDAKDEDVTWEISRSFGVGPYKKARVIKKELHSSTGKDLVYKFEDAGYGFEVVAKVKASGVTITKTVKVVNMYKRRELRDLVKEDREELLAAMWVPYSVRHEDGLKLYGKNYMDIESINNMHNYYAGDRECDHLHDGNGFSMQHLAVTLQYELSLQAINPKIVAPYWEYTKESAIIEEEYNGNFNAFFDISPVFSSDWFGDFETLQEPWSNISLPFSKTRSNAFGLMRAPWNFASDRKLLRYRSRCGFNTAEMLMSMEQPSTCESFATALGEHKYVAYEGEIMHSPHGSIHILLGGIGGDCTTKYKEDFKDHLTESSIAKVGQLAAVTVKALWRGGYINFTSCEENEERDECTQYCTSDDYVGMGRLTWNLWKAWGIEALHPDSPSDYLKVVGKTMCSTPVMVGDMYSSSATMDPLFWVMHTTTDRLTSFKRAKQFHLDDNFWPESSCFGHSPNDDLIFDIKAALGADKSLTNGELWKFSNPRDTSYAMNYVYDNFDYAHCNYTKYPEFRDDYEGPTESDHEEMSYVETQKAKVTSDVWDLLRAQNLMALPTLG